jgi:hypothetical protein
MVRVVRGNNVGSQKIGGKTKGKSWKNFWIGTGIGLIYGLIPLVLFWSDLDSSGEGGILIGGIIYSVAFFWPIYVLSYISEYIIGISYYLYPSISIGPIRGLFISNLIFTIIIGGLLGRFARKNLNIFILSLLVSSFLGGVLGVGIGNIFYYTDPSVPIIISSFIGLLFGVFFYFMWGRENV